MNPEPNMDQGPAFTSLRRGKPKTMDNRPLSTDHGLQTTDHEFTPHPDPLPFRRGEGESQAGLVGNSGSGVRCAKGSSGKSNAKPGSAGNSSEVIDFLIRQAWPGNVRQLKNVVEVAVIFARREPLTAAHVQTAYDSSRPNRGSGDRRLEAALECVLADAPAERLGELKSAIMDRIERAFCVQAMRLASGHQARAAGWLCITRTTLRQKLARFGLQTAKAVRHGSTTRAPVAHALPLPCPLPVNGFQRYAA